MKSFLLTLIAIGATTSVLFVPGAARAAGTTANLTWTNTSLYTDGSSLPLADIASNTVTWYRPGSPTPISSSTITGSGTNASVPGLICGSYEFTVKTKTTASALYPNVTSVETNRGLYNTGIPCAPNPPTGLTIS